MQSLDWIVVWAYLAGMLCLALYLSRKQTSSEDYFLGSHNLSAKTLAASTIATQCSTNSLLGAPAFVGFVAGGGMIWLQYELAVPLAMFALLWLMLPARRLGITSIYEILEHRIGRGTRLTAAGCFLLFRGVATTSAASGVVLVRATRSSEPAEPLRWKSVRARARVALDAPAGGPGRKESQEGPGNPPRAEFATLHALAARI